MFNARSLYKYKTPDGRVAGLLPTVAETAFNKAGLRYVWRDVPLARQKALVLKDEGRVCAVGLFSDPKLSARALVSRPIYRDVPFLLVSAKNDRNGDKLSFAEILRTEGATIALQAGRYYGPQMDALLAQAPQRLKIFNLDDKHLFQFIERNRADYALIEPAIYNFFSASGLIDSANFTAYTPPDMVQGLTRHLICSRNVGRETLERIDANIPIQ